MNNVIKVTRTVIALGFLAGLFYFVSGFNTPEAKKQIEASRSLSDKLVQEQMLCRSVASVEGKLGVIADDLNDEQYKTHTRCVSMLGENTFYELCKAANNSARSTN